MQNPSPFRSVAAALGALPIALGAGSAGAADFEVTNTSDTGQGSLRQAILDLNATGATDSNKITFTGLADNSTIELLSPLDPISRPVIIDGTTAVNLTIEGNGADEIFRVAGDTTTVADLALGNGPLQIGGGAFLAFDLSADGQFDDNITDAGALEKLGPATLTLTGINSYSGGTTIVNGALKGDVEAIPGNVTFAPGTGESAQLIFDQGTEGSFSGNIIGAGSLVKTGAGILTLEGANTYSGGTIIENGALKVNLGLLPGTADAIPGDVTFAPGTDESAKLIFDESDLGVFAGNISGDGVVEKDGVHGICAEDSPMCYGALQLTGKLEHTGATKVNAGLVGLTDDAVGLTGDVEIGENGALGISVASDREFAGNLNGPGMLAKAGDGELHLTGTNTHTGGTVIVGGALRADTSSLQGDVEFGYSGPGSDLAVFEDLLGSDTPPKLIFDQAFDGAFAGVISEDPGSGATGSVEKAGLGTLTLSGSNTYTGLTTVSAGWLNVDGALAGAVQVDSGAVLGGTGSIGGAVTVDGTVAPGNSIGTLTVGSVVFNSGSVLQVEVNETGGGSGDRLEVTGSIDGDEAVIRSGARVEVLAEPGDYTDGVTVTILDVTGDGTRSGTFADPEDLAFLEISLDHDSAAPDIVLTVADSGSTFESFARTPNQAAVGRALDGVGAAPGSDLEAVLQSRFSMEEEDVPPALDSVGGESMTQFATTRQAVGGRFSRALHSRVRLLDPGGGETSVSRKGRGVAAPRLWAAPGSGAPAAPAALRAASALGMAAAALGSGRDDREPGFGGWFDGYGMLGEIEDEGGANGADYTIWGASLGIDRPVTDRLLLGVAAGYARTDVDFDWPEGTGEADIFQTAVYGGYAVSRLRIGASGRYAYSAMESSRDIVFGDIRRQADADFDGHEFGARLEAALDDLELGIFGFQPLAFFDYTHLGRESYTEEGAQSLGLDVDSEQIDSIVGGAGMRIHWTFEIPGGFRLVPEIRGRWLHEFGDRDRKIEARLSGASSGGSFAVRGVELARDSGVIGAGWSVLAAGGFELAADYQLLLNQNLTEHSFGLQVRASW